MDSTLTGIKKEFEFTREDFDYLRRVVSDTTGIVSSEDKYTMYYSRLAARLRVLGLSDFRAYRDYLGKNPETESIELVNSVTTNLTSFFRERHHFEYLRDDGSESLGLMKAAGAVTIAKDEASSVVWGMPGEAVKRGHACLVLPLRQIADKIMPAVSRGG